jgi:16S rRNA methyltransferase gidB
MPGIPVAIARPDLAVTLLDANTKKTAFLQQAVIELELDNVTVSSCRVEKLTDRQADVVTSRAFAELGDFVSLSRHLLKDGGRWAAMKGVYPYEELETLPEDVEACQIDKLSVPELDAERHMVLLRPKGN